MPTVNWLPGAMKSASYSPCFTVKQVIKSEQHIFDIINGC